jgi:hypothetical protein
MCVEIKLTGTYEVSAVVMVKDNFPFNASVKKGRRKRMM